MSRLARLALSFTALTAFTAPVLLTAQSPSTPASGGTPKASVAPFSAQVLGKRGGSPMVLIPGLTNGGDVWKSTVAEFGGQHEMHVLTLAGFAGQPAIATDSGWLELMRDEVVKYVKANRLQRPVLVGHSLGGFLALWIAESSPELPGAVVNVDGLPFLGGTMDPKATVASVRPQAAQMRAQMSAPGASAQFAQMQDQQLRMMVRDTAGMAVVREMGRKSDMRTTSTAMYELYTTDLRADLSKITVPVLNLHAWAAYKAYGSTRESTIRMLDAQYAGLATVKTQLHDESYHFIMYDAPGWMHGEMKTFLAGVKR